MPQLFPVQLSSFLEASGFTGPFSR